MEALESVGNIDFVKKLSQMSGRSELAKQNMARGDKALCLVHTLKQDYDLSQEQLARYSGELAEIEAANEQCMDCNGKDCAHKPERRQLMVQADCTGGQYSMRVCPCRIQRDKLRQQRLEKLMVTAHVPVNYRQDTWKDFSLQPGNKRGLMLATMAAKENISLYLHGDCGTGKTKLTSILANERIKSGFAVLFVSLTELFRTLQDSFDMPSKEQKDKIMPLIKSARCLILDDLGTTQRTEWKVAILQEIIDYRYANVLQTIVTSNYSLSELKEHLVIRDKSGRIKDDKQASRITSRLEEMCQVAKLDTPSFRHKQEDLLL